MTASSAPSDLDAVRHLRSLGVDLNRLFDAAAHPPACRCNDCRYFWSLLVYVLASSDPPDLDALANSPFTLAELSHPLKETSQ